MRSDPTSRAALILKKFRLSTTWRSFCGLLMRYAIMLSFMDDLGDTLAAL